MRNAKEITQQVQSEVRMLMSRESEDIRHFYTHLLAPHTELSMEFMKLYSFDGWKSFSPVDVNGETIAYTKSESELVPSQSPWLFMPDSPSAGGKTTLVRNLVNECCECAGIIKTCTTRTPQPEELKTATRKIISEHPLVKATVTTQYWHISKDEFRKLDSTGFFIESLPMWDTKNLRQQKKATYGIPRSSIENVGKNNIPFNFLVVDSHGQTVASAWLHDHRPDVRFQKWFLLPIHQTFNDLSDRITFQRTEQASQRIVDAVRDLWIGASQADVIIPYPFDKSRTPHKALLYTKQFMNLLRPGVFPQILV